MFLFKNQRYFLMEESTTAQLTCNQHAVRRGKLDTRPKSTLERCLVKFRNISVRRKSNAAISEFVATPEHLLEASRLRRCKLVENRDWKFCQKHNKKREKVKVRTEKTCAAFHNLFQRYFTAIELQNDDKLPNF